MAIGDIKKREYDTVGERQGICNFNAVGERDQRSDSCLLGEIKGASRELERKNKGGDQRGTRETSSSVLFLVGASDTVFLLGFRLVLQNGSTSDSRVTYNREHSRTPLSLSRL